MIKVLKAGFYATIQDRGRVGFASIGVPVSGAMDMYSAEIANSLLNNDLDDAVLEITFGGTMLQFLNDTFIAISGANFNPVLNQENLKQNKRIKVRKGDILSFGNFNLGVRSYLAVKGGFQTTKVLKSRSQFKNITKDFRIKKDELLTIKSYSEDLKSTNAFVKVNSNHFTSTSILCFEGPEFYLLSEEQKQLLFNTVFSISSDNNRMGYRLKETIKNNFFSILTSAVLPGTVQLTPSGKLIVLMRDCQVTGGYPRILQLSEPAISILAQKKTNSELTFRLMHYTDIG